MRGLALTNAMHVVDVLKELYQVDPGEWRKRFSDWNYYEVGRIFSTTIQIIIEALLKKGMSFSQVGIPACE